MGGNRADYERGTAAEHVNGNDVGAEAAGVCKGLASVALDALHDRQIEDWASKVGSPFCAPTTGLEPARSSIGGVELTGNPSHSAAGTSRQQQGGPPPAKVEQAGVSTSSFFEAESYGHVITEEQVSRKVTAGYTNAASKTE